MIDLNVESLCAAIILKLPENHDEKLKIMESVWSFDLWYDVTPSKDLNINSTSYILSLFFLW